MTVMNDNDLYFRGITSLLAAWEEYTRASAGAALHRLDGVVAAVFTSGPESVFFNNAVLDRGLGAGHRAAAVDAMAAAYGSAGVGHYAAWVHESDEGMRAELTGRGYRLEESTRAMGMSLDDIATGLPEAALGPADWAEYARIIGVPGLLGDFDPAAFHILVASLAGENAAAGMAFDHDDDCAVFSLSTVETARRQGLGTALTARHLHDARERGCSTASLQSTPMAERVYAGVGFRDLGRILEYTPA
jgi:ribosomal protein S18 acetylase RimI-like enzyme